MRLSVCLDLADTGQATEPRADFAARAAAIDALQPDFVLLAQDGAEGQLVPPTIEALVNAAWITGILKSACVVAGLPVLHSVPFHVARALSAVDFLSDGRAGWAPLPGEASRFDKAYGADLATQQSELVGRYDDFIRATQALWDSWDQDALVLNKESGEYLDSSKVRRVDYRGPFFRTMGPLNAARPPQGYPILVRDVDSITGAEVPTDVAIGTLAALEAVDAPIKLVKVNASIAPELDAGVTAVRQGSVQGIHIYGDGALGALDSLRKVAPPVARLGTSRETLGLARPVNPYSVGAVK